MEEKPPLPHGLTPEDLVRMYVQDGRTLSDLSSALHLDYQFLRGMLVSRGVTIRGRGHTVCRGSDHPSSKLNKQDRQELEQALLDGQAHGGLARKYGLSRERVRQIALSIGAPTGREIQARQRQARKERQARRKAELEAVRRREKERRYRKWSEMWCSGMTTREIAERMKVSPGTVSVRIVNLRKEYPDWFPLRRPPAAKN